MDLTNLLSGFVGAVIGALVTAFLADRSARGLQRQDRLNQQRSGARLIVIELIHSQNILEAFRQAGAWQPDLLVRSFWESEEAKVGLALGPEELVSVGAPYLHVQALEAVAATYRARNTPGMPSTKEDFDLLQAAVDACGTAIHALRGYAQLSDSDFARLTGAART